MQDTFFVHSNIDVQNYKTWITIKANLLLLSGQKNHSELSYAGPWEPGVQHPPPPEIIKSGGAVISTPASAQHPYSTPGWRWAPPFLTVSWSLQPYSTPRLEVRTFFKKKVVPKQSQGPGVLCIMISLIVTFWIIFLPPPPIFFNSQLETLREMLKTKRGVKPAARLSHNFRPPQKIGTRTVRTNIVQKYTGAKDCPQHRREIFLQM